VLSGAAKTGTDADRDSGFDYFACIGNVDQDLELFFEIFGNRLKFIVLIHRFARSDLGLR
jgi:hypothetical protein